jgi:hypothetical protein
MQGNKEEKCEIKGVGEGVGRRRITENIKERNSVTM